MIRIRVNGNRFFELKPASIHVSCLCPGGTLTERAQHILGQNKVDRKSFYQRPEAVAAEGIRGLYQKRFRLSHVIPKVIKMMIIRIAFQQTKPEKRISTKPGASSLIRSFAWINR